MSALERRLQILLDQARYDRVYAEARRSGRSVARVIREAIDLRFPPGDDARAVALDEFLTSTEAAEGPAESWAEIKDQLEADREQENR